MAAIVDKKPPAKKGAPAPEVPRFGRVKANLKVSSPLIVVIALSESCGLI
jgi:hypothetical protein